MRLQEDRVEVQVPGTVADLGPGLGTLAIATGIQDRAVIFATTGASRITVDGEGAVASRLSEEHGAIRALRAALDIVGAPLVGVQLHCYNRIPRQAGLGDDTAEILIGLIAARGLIANEQVFTAREIINLAVKMGANPQRAAAALAGGAVLIWPNKTGASSETLRAGESDGVSSRFGSLILRVPPAINPVALVPSFTVDPAASESLLPSAVPLAQTIENTARSSLLAVLLAGTDPVKGPFNPGGTFQEVLFQATGDAYNQSARKAASPASAEMVEWLRDRGVPATLAGPGPAVVSLSKLPAGLSAMCERSGWRVVNLGVASGGAQIVGGPMGGPVCDI